MMGGAPAIEHSATLQNEATFLLGSKLGDCTCKKGERAGIHRELEPSPRSASASNTSFQRSIQTGEFDRDLSPKG